MNQTEHDFQRLMRQELSVFELSEERIRRVLIFALREMRRGMRR